MKKLRFRLLTSFFGIAALTSVVSVAAVSCSDDGASSNQNNSQTDPNDSSSFGSNSPSNTNNNLENADQKIDWAKIFPSKKVIEDKNNIKTSDAVKMIDSLDTLYEFYSKPTNIPKNYEITFSKSELISNFKNSIKVDLEAKKTGTNDISEISFLIYGFSQYSAADYILMFVGANHDAQAKDTFNNQNVHMIDPRFLSNDEGSKYFFKNYYDAVIPETLEKNNITAKLVSFKVNDNYSVAYNYQLIKEDPATKKTNIIGSPTINVSGFYDYKPFVPHAIVANNWKPNNDQFIRYHIANLTDKKEFNQFIASHWNQSLANDALNAIRWGYADANGQKLLTNNLKQYIKNGWDVGAWNHWNIGYLMGYNDSGAAKGFNPTYTSDVSLQPNGDLRLDLGWYQKQYYQRTVGGNYTADVNGSIYFDINTSTKPLIDATNSNAVSSVRLEGTINNEAKGYRPKVSDGATIKINILDALYYYYNQTSSDGIAIKNQMFSPNGANASDWAKNPYSLFKPLFSIRDDDKGKRFIYRK